MKGRAYSAALLVFTAVVLSVHDFSWTAGFVAGLAAVEVSRVAMDWYFRRDRS